MVYAMSVKEEPQGLEVCRICLATDTKLYNIEEAKLQDIFVSLIGTEASQVWCGGLGCVCSVCRAQLARAGALRTRGRRAQALLMAALKHTHYITVDYIRTIDRVAEKLCLNLKTYHVYSSDSTLQDVKLEDVKEETDDFTENIFVSAPAVEFADTNDYVDNTPVFDDNSCTENRPDFLENEDKIEEPLIYQKHTKYRNTDENSKSKSTKHKNNKHKSSIKANGKLPKSTKGSRRKAPDVERTKRKVTEATKTTKVNPTGNSKRVVKRRMADNGFLPDFNFEEFQNKYNVKIEILSKEEQLRDVEARKMAPSFTMAAYGCEECGKGFATKQVYDAHMMKHDVSAGAHSCGVCGVRSRTRSRAHVHADAHRLRFTCAVCGFLTRTRFIAKNHFLSHAGTTHQCPHCDAVFSKYTSYLTHVRRRHPAMNVACDECGETFVGPNGLRHHKTRVHRNRTVPKPSQHTCLTCDVPFASEEALAAHARSAPAQHDANIKPCPWCGESQLSAATLARHQEACACAARRCQECNKTFVDSSSFDTHYSRIHLNIRMKEPPRARPRLARLMCELCGAECSSVSSLAAHQRGHAGARPHACPQPACPRRFSTLHNMRRHHRVVHLGQRPQVACGVCGKLLAHAASLKLHVNTVHLKLPAPARRRRDVDT